MNCKPGDMAVIVETLDGSGIGSVVTVMSRDDRHVSGLPSWVVHCPWEQSVINFFSGEKYTAKYFVIPDAWLRPIRPPETPVTETRDEELTA